MSCSKRVRCPLAKKDRAAKKCEALHTPGIGQGAIIGTSLHRWRLVMRKPFRYLSTVIPGPIKPTATGVDLMLKIGTALLISFAATLVLVHAEVYLARSLIAS